MSELLYGSVSSVSRWSSLSDPIVPTQLAWHMGMSPHLENCASFTLVSAAPTSTLLSPGVATSPCWGDGAAQTEGRGQVSTEAGTGEHKELTGARDWRPGEGGRFQPGFPSPLSLSRQMTLGSFAKSFEFLPF